MQDEITTAWRGDIDWADVDAMGHVNNLAILRYVQSARIALCDRLGVMPVRVSPRIGPIVAHIEIEYRHPLFYPGAVTVTSRLAAAGHTSFTAEHTIFDEAGHEIAFEREVLVYYDYQKGEKLPLPENFGAETKEISESDIR